MADEPAELALEGTVERVVYRDDKTNFVVARFTTTEHESITIVGELPKAAFDEGLPVQLRGKWVMDKKFGRQFRVARSRTIAPKSVKGIERYLMAKVPGIGPAYAARIVKHFGLETFDILEKDPDRAREVPGIGAGRAQTISKAFAARRERSRQEADEDEAAVFLAGLGVTDAAIARIIKKYGHGAVDVVRGNPYRLAREVWGIGFRTADGIAGQLGMARDARERLEAGLLFALDTSAEDGHVHLPDAELIATAAELLGVAADLLPSRLAALEAAGLVVREVLGDRGACTSKPDLHAAEVEAAHVLAELAKTPPRGMALDVGAAIHAFQAVTGLELAAQQYKAVEAALVDKVVVITGGPGVGKTTIVKAIVHLSRLGKRRVGLAAPTGRAAKRLGEATQYEAMTIHRLLEYQPHLGGFSRNQDNPLDLDLLVVDEASMVDIPLFRSLLVAMKSGTQLVLVGDVDQLPSVGPGSVLADVIASEAATVIRLTEIFRQAAQSKIVVSAHRINQGELPDLDSPPGAADFYFIQRDDPVLARQTIVELVAERIPARFGFSATEIQVLAPMHRGDLGTAALNTALQDRLNASVGGAELVRGERVFRTGDKVMQLKNDYDKSVFNGDIGVIDGITKETSVVRVMFDGKIVVYERTELDQLVHAYAVSIHKSQGSEYAAVVLPISTQHYMMLQRSLLYTAVTRGKQLVVLVGAKRAVAMAVKNADAKRRYTWLAERVRAELPQTN